MHAEKDMMSQSYRIYASLRALLHRFTRRFAMAGSQVSFKENNT